MPRRLPAVPLTDLERSELDGRARARTSTQQAALRAEVVLRAAAGQSNTAIAAALGIARGTARHWRTRFLAEGLAGLVDRPHCPPPRVYGPEIQARIVLLACQQPADVGWAGQTHWTIQDLATHLREHPELGLGAPSKSTLHLLLQAHQLRLDRL